MQIYTVFNTNFTQIILHKNAYSYAAIKQSTNLIKISLCLCKFIFYTNNILSHWEQYEIFKCLKGDEYNEHDKDLFDSFNCKHHETKFSKS